jgi:hypothetical protein
MEVCLDERAALLARGNRGIRAVRVHVYLLAMAVLGRIPPMPEAWSYIVGRVSDGRLSPEIAWTPSDIAYLATLAAAAALIGQGMNRVASGLPWGRLRLLLGVFLVAWFIFSPFFFGPKSFRLTEYQDYWPTKFLAVYYGGMLLYFVVAAYSIHGILALDAPVVREQLTSYGFGQSVPGALKLLCFGSLDFGAFGPRPLVWILALAAAFFLGWGMYVFYGIPLGLMWIVSITETRAAIGHRFFFETSVLINIAKVVFAFLVIGFGRFLLHYARVLASPRSLADLRHDSRRPTLFLRPFEYDRASFHDLSQSLSERLFDLETGSHSIEEIVVQRFRRIGPVVSVGSPAERTRHDGALRLFLPPEQGWQATVLEMMRSARVIVIVIDESEGLLWELRAIREHRLTRKTVMIFPAVGRQRAWSESFSSFLAEEIGLADIASEVRERADLLAAHRPAAGKLTIYTVKTFTRSAFEAGIFLAGRDALQTLPASPWANRGGSALSGDEAIGPRNDLGRHR